MMPFNVGGGSGDLADAITGTSFPSPAGSAFTYGTLNFSQTDLLLQFLQNDTSTRIVQAPKILALDNQEATIFIGESVRYARTTAATNQNGGLTFGVEEDPNSPVNVGFQLLVIPNVIRGEQKIMMTVIPQRRALNGTTSPIIGFDRIEVCGPVDRPAARPVRDPQDRHDPAGRRDGGHRRHARGQRARERRQGPAPRRHPLHRPGVPGQEPRASRRTTCSSRSRRAS